jgi:hypothetical protein
MALLAQVSTQKLLTRHIQGYGSVDIFDEYTKPGFLTLGAVTFNTSSTTDSYSLVNNPFLTGSISSFGILHTDYAESFVESGSLYISSLYFGNVGGTVAGQLTTDATATDLFWKGSKLNDQSGGGGGGITTSQLTSTTIGLGTIGYISTVGGGISAAEVTSTVVGLGSIGYVSSTQLVSTTENIITGIVDLVNNLGSYGYLSTGGQGIFSTVYINMLPQDAPPWDSRLPIAGSDPEPNPLALDIFGSMRVIKNIYVGSTTTVLGTAGITTQQLSTLTMLTSSVSFYNTSNTYTMALSNNSLQFNGGTVLLAGGSNPEFISSQNLLNLVSTTFLNTALASTVAGVGTGGLTAIPSTLSTSAFFTSSAVISTATIGIMSSLITNASLVSTQRLFASTSFITYDYSVSSVTSSLTIAGPLNMAYNPISNADTLQLTKLYYVNPNSNAGGTYTVYSSGGVVYGLHAFTSVGTVTFSNASAIANARVLIVAGGGGGGTWIGGGGGAGGLISLTNQSITSASYSIVVGSGGTGAIAGTTGAPPFITTAATNGNNSSAFSQTAVGGGRGGSYPGGAFSAGNGGSGGGGAYSASSGTGTSGQGNNGGSNSIGNGSGGGGAGTAGSNAANDPGAAGNGGDGLANDITGTSLYYAGGGGGGTNQTSPATGLGGLGGGGNGANGGDPTNGGNATFYGGGGGGGTRTGAIGGTGYQGVVYIAYPLSQYTTAGIAANLGSVGGDSNYNLTIQPTSNLSIVGNTQVSGSLTASTFSTGLFNMPYERLGTTSSLTTVQFYGLQGNYNNTVLAEISTGAGTQEFLVFKGSSASDRVRVQTTGNFVVETGVSARLWSNTTIPTLSNVTPAFIINSSSNVGIQTATPATTLDVAGTGRFQTLSSLALYASSIVAPYVFQPQFFTF